jgi:thymidine phosphorylase
LRARPAEAIEPGEPLAEIYTASSGNLDSFAAALVAAFRFGDEQPPQRSLIVDRFAEDGWKNL